MNMVIVWCVVAVASLLLEIITVGSMSSIWFTVGALIALLATILKASIAIQIVLFVIVSIVSFITLRPLVASYMRGNIVPTNADRFIGTFVKVSKEISSDSWGEVMVMGMPWHAVEVNGETVAVGTKVKVLAIEGAKMIVKK